MTPRDWTPEAWCRRYERAFVACAVERGWAAETAEVWAWDYSDKALMHGGDRTPEQMAQADVVEIENDDSNA